MDKFNIVLTSSGFNDLYNFVSKQNKDFLHSITKNKKVMVLSNAAPEGTGNFIARECVRKNFVGVGAKQVDIIDISDANLSQILDYDIIYVLGGDPFYLIELNKNPKFKETIVKLLKTGIYIGESAGSMILCDDLEWAYIVKKGTKPKYDIKLKTYKGLGLTKYKIFPHWNKVSDSVKTKTINFEKDKLIEITKLNDGDIIKIKYPSSEI